MATPRYVHPAVELPRNTDRDFTLQIYESDAYTARALAADDVVRFKVWDSADVDTTPTLDLDSVALSTATFTADAGTDEFTSSAHGLSNGQRVLLTTSGTLPGGVTTLTQYYVVNSATNTFKVAATSGGTAINITSTGSGTHTWTRCYSRCVVESLGTQGSAPGTVRVEMYRDEINLLTAGEWNWAALVVMPSRANRAYEVARGTFDVTDNSAGDLGAT